MIGNHPVRGLGRPLCRHAGFGDRRRDQGAKILSSLCANVAGKEEKEIAQTLAGIPDPVGTFYRYGLASSMLRRKVDLADSRE